MAGIPNAIMRRSGRWNQAAANADPRLRSPGTAIEGCRHHGPDARAPPASWRRT